MAATERSIIEAPSFKLSRDALTVSCKQLDDALEEITLLLARLPDYFPYIGPGKEMRRCRTKHFPPDVLPYDLIFEFDADTVTLLYVGRAFGRDSRL